MTEENALKPIVYDRTLACMMAQEEQRWMVEGGFQAEPITEDGIEEFCIALKMLERLGFVVVRQKPKPLTPDEIQELRQLLADELNKVKGGVR